MKKNNELKTVIIMLLLVFIGFCSTPSFLIAEETGTGCSGGAGSRTAPEAWPM